VPSSAAEACRVAAESWSEVASDDFAPTYLRQPAADSRDAFYAQAKQFDDQATREVAVAEAMKRAVAISEAIGEIVLARLAAEAKAKG
jgi:hypothetical protein